MKINKSKINFSNALQILSSWHGKATLPTPRPRFFNFAIRLRLDLGYKALIFASTTNLESGPRFADIWWRQFIEFTNFCFSFQNLVHELNEKCWDVCVDKPSSKMDSRTEGCLRNCVDRFIDTNLLVTQHLEKKIPEYLNQHDSTWSVLDEDNSV